MTGQSISHYRVLEKLGEGGMGEVYLAEDTSLGRLVALKFLAAHLLNDHEAKQRFLREAKAAAAITHPNICTVHEVSEEGGKTFLAMAYLEGESLEDKIARGPLPPKEALDIGRQIALGLEAAHEKGIIHRDIKPANIMIDGKGRAIILDFGLARLTQASKLTRADQTLGTAAYMSPEQIQGGDVDQRTDIWALGCVIHEMVAGDRPFKGQYDQALAYEIVHEEPESLTGIRSGVPMELEMLVGKCLAKDPEDRYAHIDEIARDLRTLAVKFNSAHSFTIVRRKNTVTRRKQAFSDLSQNRFLLASLAALAILALVAQLRTKNDSGDFSVRKFFFPMEIADNAAVLSPNGRHIVYRTGPFQRRIVWIRDLDSEYPRQIAEPERNNFFFWSPDSRFVAFRSGENLVKVPVEGGPPVTISGQPGEFYGGTWSPDGNVIVFAAGSPRRLYSVPAHGGTPSLLFQKSDDLDLQEYAHPHFLPEGAACNCLLYSKGTRLDSDLVVGDLDRGTETKLGVSGFFPFYSSSGHILYQTGWFRYNSDLWALPFSPAKQEASGERFPVRQLAGGASVARDGTLLFQSAARPTEWELLWLNRDGREIAAVGSVEQSLSAKMALSPDGSHAVIGLSNVDGELWIYDTVRGSRTRFLTPSKPVRGFAWSPDGKHLAYGLTGGGIHLKSIDSNGEVEPIFEDSGLESPVAWSSDGRRIIYLVRTALQGDAIWYLERGDDDSGWKKHSFLASQFNETTPSLSPDGRWLAYASDESGKFQVYVKPFPEGGRAEQISTKGGFDPQWSPDGGELFFRSEGSLVAVTVSVGSEVSIGSERRLFEFNPDRNTLYAIDKSGERILALRSSGPARSAAVHFVQNWYKEFRDREQD